MADFHVDTFPYRYPDFVPAVLETLCDGLAHDVVEIRSRVAVYFSLTEQQLSMKHTASNNQGVFRNKVAHVLARLKIRKAVIDGSKGAGWYVLTPHGLDVVRKHNQKPRIEDFG
jgi:restriction endonuclease Mrr